MVTSLILCFLACLFSLALTQVVRWFALAVGAVDHPAHRKLHHHPVPRLGGVAIVGAMAATIVIAVTLGLLSRQTIVEDSALWGALLAGGGIIFICGVWDDVSSLSARTKFAVQVAAAGIAVWCGVQLDRIVIAGDHTLELGMFAVPVTLLWIVGITNAFNLIDGLDGLAAGLGSIASATCAAIFLYSGAIDDATLLLILLGALLGFLPHNFHPAKLFLGDSGSLVLGYLLSVMVITGSQKYATATAVIIPLLTLAIPIVDTLLSMVRRLLSGQYREGLHSVSWSRVFPGLKQVFTADRDHIHHRLIARGFSHRNAVLLLYGVAAGLSSLAFVAVLAQYRNAVLLLMTVAVAMAIGVAKLGYLNGSASRIGFALERVDGPKFDRSFFFGFADLVLVAMAYWGSYALVVGHGEAHAFHWYLNMFPLVALVQLSLFWTAGLYRGLWRAVGVGDLMRVAIAVSVSGALSYALVMIDQPPAGADGLFVVHTLALGWLMGGLRSAYRLFEHSEFAGVMGARPVVIYGAGLGGRLLLRELRQNAKRGFHAIGFVDDDRSLRGRMISGIPVLGTSHDLSGLFAEHRVQAVILSTHAIAPPLLRQASLVCREHGVTLLRSEYLVQPLACELAEMSHDKAARPWEGRIRELRRLRSDIASLRKTAT